MAFLLLTRPSYVRRLIIGDEKPCSGEVACTGLHGGNRLASTSLLEGLVWGCSVADHLADDNQRDSKNGLLASANLGAMLDPHLPVPGAPPASPAALSRAWSVLR